MPKSDPRFFAETCRVSSVQQPRSATYSVVSRYNLPCTQDVPPSKLAVARPPFQSSRRRRFDLAHPAKTAAGTQSEIPSDAPRPIHCGSGDRTSSTNARLKITGIATARSGSCGRSSANSDRDVSSSRLQPIRLGANPRNTAETRRVDCAVKLPRWNSSAISGSRNAMPTAQPATADQRHQRDGLIDQAGTPARNWKRLRRRAISGSSEFETGLIR